ncbi:potassium channel family protein [Geodermatophilus sp. SYSU D00691]
MGWVVTAIGGAVVLAGLRDIFHTLWHPGGRGGFSERVMVGIWRAGRRRRHGRFGGLAGPIAMGVVVVAWVLVIVLGWALVYWPHLPSGFVYGSGLDPDTRAGFLDAVYLSTVSVATLGFGDIVPHDPWLRMVVPLQGLVGFALLTAAVSWVLQVFPALTRRRALAIRLVLLARTDACRLVEREDSPLAVTTLEALAADVVEARVDLAQYPETYYFRDGDEESSLPATLGIAADLAAAGAASPAADARFAGDLLGHALDDFARVVDEQFLRSGAPTAEVLRAYAAEHGHRVLRAR